MNLLPIAIEFLQSFSLHIISIYHLRSEERVGWGRGVGWGGGEGGGRGGEWKCEI